MDWKGFTKYEGMHKGKRVIWLQLPYDREMIKQLKKVCPLATWSKSKKCWYAPDTPSLRKLLAMDTKPPEATHPGKLPDYNRKALDHLVQQLQFNAYSQNTIKVYRNEFLQLLYAINKHSVNKLTEQQLKAYFLYCLQKQGLSELHLNSRINAVKFYFEQVLHRKKMFLNIPRPKKPSTLPKFFSEAEIQRLFNVVANKKHLLMLKLAYGMGIRVSEIVNLRIEHIDSKSMQVLIASARGKKDRYVNLPSSILAELRAYYKEYKPETYLFEGQYGGQYSVRSVQAVFKAAMKKAKIRKKIGVHGLRHSYATHLLEAGTDISYIQKLLGHKDIRTTLAYMHAADKSIRNIRSPLDRLK